MNRPVPLPVLSERPAYRSQCARAERPCAWVSCRYHLFLDVGTDGRLLLNRMFVETSGTSIAAALHRMPATCALDVADLGAHTRQEVATLLGSHAGLVRHTEQATRGRLSAAFLRLHRDTGLPLDV